MEQSCEGVVSIVAKRGASGWESGYQVTGNSLLPVITQLVPVLFWAFALILQPLHGVLLICRVRNKFSLSNLFRSCTGKQARLNWLRALLLIEGGCRTLDSLHSLILVSIVCNLSHE